MSKALGFFLIHLNSIYLQAPLGFIPRDRSKLDVTATSSSPVPKEHRIESSLHHHINQFSSNYDQWFIEGT